MIDDIIINYSNTNDLIQRKLNEKCDGIGISIDKVICFFNKSRSKPSILYTYKTCILYAISTFKSDICLIKILKGA